MRPHLPTMSTPLSVLDLAPITEGSDAAQSFRNSLALAMPGMPWCSASQKRR